MLPVYHQQAKNLLVSYSPKKLGFPQSAKSSSRESNCPPGASSGVSPTGTES